MANLRIISCGILMAALALGITGCGGNHEYPVPSNLYPVHGMIRVGGKPLGGGLLTCILVSENDMYGAVEAPAEVRPDGTFEPVLFNGRPGLYPGRWKVVVKSTTSFKNGIRQMNKVRVPSRYTREETSDLYIDVAEGVNSPTLVLR